MTLLTDDGREWYGDKAHDFDTSRLDAIGLGSGSGAESPSASSLSTEEYRNDHTGGNVTFEETGTEGQVLATIEVTGGSEVPAGTTITEMAIFAGGAGGGGIMIWVDEFAGVTVESGHTRGFEMPYRIERP